MTSMHPTGDLRGTEPADQTDDPTLTDDGGGPTGSVAGRVPWSGPGIVVAIALLVVFIVILLAAVGYAARAV
jgi:hypothetical protein